MTFESFSKRFFNLIIANRHKASFVCPFTICFIPIKRICRWIFLQFEMNDFIQSIINSLKTRKFIPSICLVMKCSLECILWVLTIFEPNTLHSYIERLTPKSLNNNKYIYSSLSHSLNRFIRINI